jgi:LysR family glycine cleavage system transcriptional activator
MCAPEFIERHGLHAPEDVLRVPRLSPDDEWWDQWLEESGVTSTDRTRGRGIRLDSQVAEGQAAMAGHGLSMLTPVYWRAELASGRLLKPFERIICERRALWLVYPEHKRTRSKIRLFRDWLLGEVAIEAANGPEGVFTPPAETR